jgi:hypothetical protein
MIEVYHGIELKELRTTMQILDQVAVVPVEMCTSHFLTASVEHYHCINLFGLSISFTIL